MNWDKCLLLDGMLLIQAMSSRHKRIPIRDLIFQCIMNHGGRVERDRLIREIHISPTYAIKIAGWYRIKGDNRKEIIAKARRREIQVQLNRLVRKGILNDDGHDVSVNRRNSHLSKERKPQAGR